MDQQDLAPFDDFLDFVAADRPVGASLLDIVDVAAANGLDPLGIRLTVIRGIGFVRFRLCFRRFGGFVLGDKRFAVGDRDLVVVGMNFTKGQETVAVAAVVDKGSLERGLDPRHLC